MTEAGEKITYRVPGENMEALRGRLAKMARRATRLGVGAVTLVVEGIENTVREDGYVESIHSVSVEGPTPKLAGWTLVGVINIDAEAGTIVRGVPGVTEEGELGPYRKVTEHWCDHCRTRRYRLDTFIVRHDNGEHKQVGRQCLASFLGGVSPEEVVAMAEMLMSAGDACEDEGGFSGAMRSFDRISLHALLTQVAAEMREQGWVSRGAAREDSSKQATVDSAIDRMELNAKCKTLCGDPNRHRHLRPNDEDATLADTVIEWVRALDPDVLDQERSDYLPNLYVACRSDVPQVRQAGLAGSAIIAYNNHLSREVKRKVALDERKASKALVADAKGKVTTTLTVVEVREIPTAYGASNLHKFVDVEGNRASWFASSEKLTVGSTYTVTATLKGFNTQYGETQLTRCKCKEVAPVTSPADMVAC